MAVHISLPSPRAIAAEKKYRENLVRMGGSDMLQKRKDGAPCVRFSPWLAKASPEVRLRVADLILSSFRTGRPLKEVARDLKKILGTCESKSYRIIRREIRRLQHEREFFRFREMGIRQGTWKLDLEEGTHTRLKGKIFSLDDPIWNELNLDGCLCWCEPVVPDT